MIIPVFFCLDIVGALTVVNADFLNLCPKVCVTDIV